MTEAGAANVSAADTVYDLWYIREFPGSEDVELHIGIYQTEPLAREAIVRLSDQPGFRDWPEGFEIHPTLLNQDGWTEGFGPA
jgi:hypothetical protein